MTTFEQPISLGMPDTSGDIYPSKISIESTGTSRDQDCVVMEFPTGSDIGVSTGFVVPRNYAGSPVLLIKGVLDGTPANVLAFGAQQIMITGSMPVGTSYEAEDTANNSTWTGLSDGDFYEESIVLTPSSSYLPGQKVFLWFYRDNSVDTTTFNFLLTDLLFQYSDT